MIITNVTGSYFLKQNDTATKMRLFISEADGVTPVDLARAIRLEVVIGVPEGRVLVKTPTILEEPGQLEFGLDDGDLLPTGDDRLEVHVFYAENMKRVAPSKGYYKLRIQEPIDELAVEVTTFTLDYFIGEVNRLTGNIPAIAEQARELLDELQVNVPLATQVLSDAQEASTTALTAANNAAAANGTFDAIIPVAQQAALDARAGATAANSAATLANTNAGNAQTATSNAQLAATTAQNAADNANQAANIANSTVASLEDLQDDLTGYTIPIVDFTLGTTFLKGQTARFNGSTYRAKVVTQGNPLPAMPALENEWWTLVAQRGVDGEGAVSSVNGIQPNGAGDVILPLPEPTWDSVLNKPTVFPPSAHTHSWTQITDKPTEFTPVAHTHPIAQVEELQETIDNINMSIDAIGQTGIPKLATYQYVVPATSNGQTQIEIPLDTFNVGNDTLFLYRNRTAQEPTAFSVTNTTITLNEPVTDYVNTSFHIRILKNIPIGPAGSIDASVLLNGSIEKEKLSTAVQNELSVIASPTQLGHIKPDGTTLEVDASTGIMKVIGGGGSDYSLTDGDVLKNTIGLTDANDLIDTGFYLVENDVANTPVTKTQLFKWSFEVFSYQNEGESGKVVMQIARDYNDLKVYTRRRAYTGLWTLWKSEMEGSLQKSVATSVNDWNTSDFKLTKDASGVVHVNALCVASNFRTAGIQFAELPTGFLPSNTSETIYFNVFNYSAAGVPVTAAPYFNRGYIINNEVRLMNQIPVSVGQISFNFSYT